MTDTPIIDAAIRAGCKNCLWPGCHENRACHNHAKRSLDTLRAALPWTPPAEVIEAMARAYSTDWDTADDSQRDFWLFKSVDTYRAQPIMRELYPERL